MNYRSLDEIFMAMAIDLAHKGQGHVNPNPLVGAVVVKNEKVLGTGFHQKYGSHHAEVNAIIDAKENGFDVTGATIYVNLEPCSHTNKQTPPCAPLIVKEKIQRVVISNIDPNPNVSGNGIKLLEENNIEVTVGILKDEGEKLNEVFFKAMREKSPFVHLKMGQTLDGKVATLSGESKYITSNESLQYVHQLRQSYDGIIVGKNTVLKDNPSLTVRLENIESKHPLRIIFINLSAIDFNLKVFSDEFKRNTMVVTTDIDVKQNENIVRILEANGIAMLALAADQFGRVDLKSFLSSMHSLKLNSLLLEGGPTLASAFLALNLVDKISVITAPYLLGEGMSTLNFIGINKLDDKKEIKNLEYKNLGKDFLVEGYLCSPV